MKLSILILPSLFFLTACHTNSSLTDKSTISKQNETIELLKSILNGYWVEPTYINDVSKTKSPFKSQNTLAAIVELDIDTSDIKDDSIEVRAPDIHEGTSFTLYFRPGITATSIPTNIKDYETETNFYELGYELTNKDTSLIIYHYNKDKKLLEQTKYIKVPKNTEGALQYMVNKTLFAGNYKTTDSLGQTINVQFTNDGIVTGFANFKKFYILTDFVADSETSLDQVCFDIQTPNQKCYVYKIKDDTINLYELVENENAIAVRLGQLKYKLIK